MGKQLQKMIFMGTLPFLLGLGACSLTWDEPVSFEDEVPEDQPETVALSDILVADVEEDTGLSAPCVSDAGDCEETENYLTQEFTQKDPNMMDNSSISLSRPAGKKALSVKEKQAMKAAPVAAAGSAVVAVKAPGEKSQKTETEDKVLYTTVAIPEEIGSNKTTETTVTTTKITKKPAEETAPAEIPAGMMPLKKTVTTITETTTKVKEEKKEEPQKDFHKMTLAEKVAYGESVQEWDARAGSTLRTLLMDWGNKSGWTVVWKLDRDYHLEAGVIFKGTFVDVSSALIRSFARATPAPIGTFHQGNRVLVISTQEDENER